MDKHAFLSELKASVELCDEHLQEAMSACSVLIDSDMDMDPAAVIVALGEMVLCIIQLQRALTALYTFLGGK